MLQVVGLQAPIEGYGVVDLEWEVEVSPGGKTVILNGTVEKVRDELVKLNPNWDEDYAARTEPLAKRNDGFELAARADFTNARFFCRGRWPECPAPRISGGIAYLRRIQGRPTNGPGPGNCGRVSCSYQSAIWWCNDVSYPCTVRLLSSRYTLTSLRSFRMRTLKPSEVSMISQMVHSMSTTSVFARFGTLVGSNSMPCLLARLSTRITGM